MDINIHSNIQQNKRVFAQKLWEESVAQMTYTICNKGIKLQQDR
jgi:hypothetical protein